VGIFSCFVGVFVGGYADVSGHPYKLNNWEVVGERVSYCG